MNKRFVLIFIILLLFACSCGKKNKNNEENKDEPKINKIFVKEDLFVLKLGESKSLDVETLVYDISDELKYEILDTSIISIEGNIIKGLKVGSTILKVSLKEDSSVFKDINVKVELGIDVKININGPSEVNTSDIFELDVTSNYSNAVYDVFFDDCFEKIDDFTFKALKSGKGKIKVVLDQDNSFYKEIEIDVIEFIPTLEVEKKNYEIFIGDEVELEISTNLDYDLVKITNSSPSVISLNEGRVKGLSIGDATLTVSLEGTSLTEIISFKVVKLDTTGPVFSFDGTTKDLKINWNTNIDLTEGVKALDEEDGDCSKSIKVISNFDNKEYGVQKVTLEASDSKGNKTTIVRNIEVYWGYDITFIGHAGCYYGIMNTEDAFLYAAKNLHYQALECDVKQTKDGVFVVCHDDTFNGVTISATNYADLKNVTNTVTRNGGIPLQKGLIPGNGKYTSTICTLDSYLKICKQYNIIAVIELKSSNGITQSDQSRMSALMKVISDNDMLNQVIFLGSQYNCLSWVKKNGYEYIPCQYLVNSCESDAVLSRCIEEGFDLSINVTGDYSNSEEWLAKYYANDIKVSTWTFTQWVDYDEVQEWIDKGASFVTCDWHEMDKLKLPLYIEPVYHNVTFNDADGSLIKVVKVKDGKTAGAPSASKPGYKFVGWSGSISNVKEDITVNAIYEIENYDITYVANTQTKEEVEWENKEAFCSELYTDLYNWFISMNSKLAGLSVSGNSVTFTKNSVTVKFSNVTELRALDIYDVEKTIGNIMYKPIATANSESYVPEVDNMYFLNTEPYRTKYINMNAYLLNCMNVSYTSYSKTYTPTSAGKVQIFFRFHQWMKGTAIASLNTLPKKVVLTNNDTTYEVVLPIDHISYNIESDFTLSKATCNGGLTFIGWYKDEECLTEKIESISPGQTGNLILYAKWEIN